jgi:uncharacterized protein YceK
MLVTLRVRARWRANFYTEEESMTRNLLRAALLTVAATTLAGCATYYKVTDPASGREYYTTQVDKSREGGAVTLRDDKTKSEVTLQSSEITEIEKSTYDAALKSK